MSLKNWLRSLSVNSSKQAGRTSGSRHSKTSGKRQKPARRIPRLETLEDRTLLNAGDLDLGFGVEGLVVTEIGGVGWPAALAVQPDGRFLVAGHIYPPAAQSDFVLFRWNETGTLDDSFGTGGRVTTDFAGDTSYPSDNGRALAVQTDGRILVVGSSYQGNDRRGDFAVARYNTDGTLDASFGAGGKVTTDVNSTWDYGSSLVIQPDGRILVAGHAVVEETGKDSLALVRYDANGSLDPTFGVGGKLVTNIGGSNLYTPDGYPWALALQPDGRFVVGGTIQTDATGLDLALVRFNADGSFDTSFGVGGIRHVDLDGGDDSLSALVVQPDGRILVTGWAYSSLYGGANVLTRFLSDGNFDSSFGIDGPVGGGVAVAVQPNGRILSTDYIGRGWVLGRANGDGSIDESFGNYGGVRTQFPGVQNAGPTALALAPDGKILVAGWVAGNGGGTQMIALARYEGDPVPVNQPPSAQGDSYALDEDDSLTVAAPGVLANDTDPDGNPLRAILVSDATRGTLQLNTDGSFTYTPSPNYNGPDSFTYKANDGQAHSNVVMVTINVDSINDSPTTTVSLNDHAPRTNAVLKATATASDVDGDPITLTYTWKVNGIVKQTHFTTELVDTFDLSVPGQGDRGESITVEVTPHDGQVAGTTATDSAAVLAAFVVTNTNDNGPGSLRQAIEDANAMLNDTAGPDEIRFAIGSGPRSIALLSALPAITDPVLLDGWSQPGLAGAPLIELNGAAAGSSHGLVVHAPDTIIRGLVINHFAGYGVHVASTSNTWIYGNYIGLDATGTVGMGNATGVLVQESSGVVVGSNGDNVNVELERNVISGNFSYPSGGVYVFRSTNTTIRGNYLGSDFTGNASILTGSPDYPYGNGNSNIFATESSYLDILDNLVTGGSNFGMLLFGDVHHAVIQGNRVGTDADGTEPLVGAGAAGIWLQDRVHDVLIGGTEQGQGNLVSGNWNGIAVFDGANITLQGNYVGTDAAGSDDVPNRGIGVLITNSTGDIHIGGTVPGAGNLISGNLQQGIAISGMDGAVWVQGNKIGTDVYGANAIENYIGIGIAARGVTIGGDSSARNLISGNGFGLFIDGNDNLVEGNYIGTDDLGTHALPNQNDGLELRGTNNTARNNLISGNSFGGILVGGVGNLVQENKIGTDITGNGPLANNGAGVVLSSSHDALIRGNLISANTGNGIEIGYPHDSSGNRVQGNRVGTNADGTLPLGNGGDGIWVSSLLYDDNVIGGSGPGEGNVISGNHGNGISIFSSALTVLGNKIGADASGTLPLGNDGDGVLARTNGKSATIGGISPGQGNVIAFNGRSGVDAQLNATFVTVRGNSIHDNADRGIFLSYGGNTGNNSQAFPVLSQAFVGAGTRVSGTLTSAPNSIFALDFYRNASADSSGVGEGQSYVGSTNVTTDAAGHVSFDVTIPGPSPAGNVITAAATDAAGNTSEFSAAIVAAALPSVQFSSGSMASIIERDTSVGANVGVSLSAAAPLDVTVPFTVGGTAAQPGDYTLSTSSVLIRQGTTSAVIPVFMQPDLLDEPDETVILTLGAPENAFLGSTTTFTLTIQDDDTPPLVWLTSDRSSAPEGTSVIFTAHLSTASGFVVSVPWTIAGATIGSDYTADASGTFSFAAGAKSTTLTVPVVDDTTPEGSETFTLTLGQPTHATLVSPNSKTATIPANDAPSVSLSPGNGALPGEGWEVTRTIQLSAASTQDVFVPFTFGGTTTGADYTWALRSGTLVSSGLDASGRPYGTIKIPAGSLSATISVSVRSDGVGESAETIVMSLGTPSNATLQWPWSNVLTIPANDTPTLYFDYDTTLYPTRPPNVATKTVKEDAGNVVVGLTLSNAVDHDLIVPIFGTRSGNDTTGVDYTFPATGLSLPSNAVSGVLIPAFQRHGSLTISLDNDLAVEPELYLNLTMGAVSGVSAASPKSYRLTIEDEDLRVSFSQATQSIVEASQDLTVTAKLRDYYGIERAANRDVTVSYQVTGTATNHEWYDYTIQTANPLVIRSGRSSASITVHVREDSEVEPDETVILTMTSTTQAELASNGTSHTLTIVDSDQPLVSFATTSKTVREDVRTVTVTANLSTPAFHEVTVPIATTGSTASYWFDLNRDGIPDSGSDYRIPNDTRASITFPVNSNTGKTSTSATITVTVFNDTRHESTEKVVLTMGRPTNAKKGSMSVYTLSITDNDPLQISVEDGEGAPVIIQPRASSAPVTAQAFTLGVTTDAITGLSVPNNLGSLVPNVPNTVTAATVGTAAVSFGYVSGAVVIFDANKNGLFDYLDLNSDGSLDPDEPLEPVAVTGLNGRFTMSIPDAFDRNSDGVIDPTEGHLLSLGGVDTSTGLPAAIPLVATPGNFTLTPITTLMAVLVEQQGFTPDDAAQRVREALTLPDIDLSRFDAIAETVAGNLDGASIFAASAKLQDTILQAVGLIANAPGAPPAAFLTDLAMANLAASIVEPDALLDLSEPAVVESVLNGLLATSGTTLDPAIVTGAANVIAAANQHLDGLTLSANEQYLTEVVQTKVVTQATTAVQLGLVAAGQASIDAVVRDFTGAALAIRIDAAPVGTIVPPALAITNVRQVEGDNGDSFFDFTVSLDRPSSRPISVDYSTFDGGAIAGEDYETEAGHLAWAAGDTSSRLIRVRVHGNSAFESDETFVVQLYNASHVTLYKDIGVGAIVNDDALTYIAPGDSGPNQIDLQVDGESVQLVRNDEILLYATLAVPVPITIVGADDVTNTLTLEVKDAALLQAGLWFQGGNADDQFRIQDGGTAVVTHNPTTSSLLIDDAFVRYTGVETIDDEMTADITGVPALTLEGSEISLAGVVPDTQLAAVLNYEWSVTRNGVVAATGSGAGFQFTPNDNGAYEVFLTIRADGRGVGTTQRSILVHNAAPAATLTSDGPLNYDTATVRFVALSDASTADLSVGLHFAFALDPALLANATYAGSNTIASATFILSPGIRTIYGRVFDKDGGSTSYSISVVVAGVSLENRVLQLYGTQERDIFFVSQHGSIVRVDSRLATTWHQHDDDDADDNEDKYEHDAQHRHFSFSVANVTSILVVASGGNDRIHVGNRVAVSASINGGAGDDVIHGGGGNYAIVDLLGDNIIHRGPGAATIQVGDGNNEIHTGGAADTIVAGDGNNRIWSDGVSDMIIAGHGNNEIHAGQGNNVIAVGNGHNRVFTNAGNDQITAGNGNNSISGGAGNDLIVAGDGNNTIDGDAGDDQIITGHGRDTINGGAGSDLVRAGGGNDILDGGAGCDVLVGGTGDDFLLGDDGRDFLIGGYGADRIVGNQGEDILVAGYTSFDANDAALLAIMSEWTSSKNYATRVANIINGGGANGMNRLVGDDGDSQTVFDDSSVDVLTGSQGTDWFFANRVADNGGPLDIITDRVGNEQWNDTDF